MKSTGMINDRLNGNQRYRFVRYLCLALLLFVVGMAISIPPLQAANEGDNIPISIEDETVTPPVLLGDDQQNPTIIALPDKNKWFVVWEDWRNWSASGADIYGRFINDDGSLCGDEIVISEASGNQTVPTAAYRNSPSSSADNVMIAWQDTRAASGHLAYKLLDISSLAADCSSGATLGSEVAVGYSSIGGDSLTSRKLPKIAYDTARDQFWLVWIESRDALQRIEELPFGVAPWTTYWNFGDSSYIGYTSIAAASGTPAAVEIIRNVGSFDRTVRLISHSTTASEDVYIYEYFKNVNNVTIACDESSPEALIVWEGVRGRATLTCTFEDVPEEDPVTGPDPDDNFFAELVLDEWDNDDGQVHIFSLFDKYIDQSVVHSQLVDASSKSSFYPAVGFDSAHRKFLVAWEDRDARDGAGDGVHSKIFAQLIYSGGGLYGLNLPISFQDTNGDGAQDQNILSSNQTRPQVSTDSTNQRFFVTWQDGRNSQVSLENLDIFGQFVDSEGSLRGNNYAVCVEAANQYNPVTAYNPGNHQFMTVWKDARNLNTTNSDIYGQRFTLGQPQLILLNEDDTPLVPPLLDFGSVQSGESPTLSVKMKNTGDSTIQIDYVTPLLSPFSYVALPPELGSVDGSTINLVPGASYNLYIRFAPTVDGTYIDNFTIQSDAANLTVNLQGVRVPTVPPVAGIRVSPSSGFFGSVTLGESKSMVFTFSNTGNVDVEIKGADVPGAGFSVTGLSGTINAGEDLVALVTFSPDQPRSYSGTLRVFYDFGVAANSISLSGVGVTNIIAGVHPPGDIDFGNATVGESKSANLVFTNTGNVDVVITAIDQPGSSFNISGIPATIPAYGTLNALATFTPTLPQSYSSTLRVLYDNGLPTSEIVLSGAGVDLSTPAVTVEPQTFSFGKVALGATRTETLVITNTGNVDFEIVAIDLPSPLFTVKGLSAGSLAEGMSKVATLTFAPDTVGDFSSVMRILFDHDLPPQEISLQGSGMEIDVSPDTLEFPNSEVGSITVLDVTITNSSELDLQIKGAATGSDTYSVSGFTGGDILVPGTSITGQVAFKPTSSGFFEDTLYLSIGPVQDMAATPFEEIDWGTQYEVLLQGIANADFVYSDVDSFTADLDYQLSASASTNQSGQLFILFSHDPHSSGEIYALAQNGTLQPFPYQAAFGWQNLWYLDSASPGLKVDLSQVDFRPLGCSLCQGEKIDDGGNSFNFGNIIINPPDDEVFNNASDFKYMGGTLYIATYIKNAFSGGAFDFNKDLLEMQSLNIHSLAGTWQVTSSYYGVDRVHSTFLEVTEPGDGSISAIWPPYYPTMAYSSQESGYVMTFNMGIYVYTYKITSLTEDSFAGSYTCVANGVIIAENEPVSGVRVK